MSLGLQSSDQIHARPSRSKHGTGELGVLEESAHLSPPITALFHKTIILVGQGACSAQ
jgi:hypothetical protein